MLSLALFTWTLVSDVSSDLKFVIERSQSPRHLVRWDNVEHRHEIFEDRLKFAYDRLADAALTQPQVLTVEVAKLRASDRQRLMADRTDLRTEIFDVLSASIKQKIQKDFTSQFPQIPLERGLFWSFAKSLLRFLLGESAPVERVEVLRQPGASSKRGAFICIRDQIKFQKLEIPLGESVKVSCGATYTISSQNQKSNFKIAPVVYFPSSRETDLEVSVSIGLSSSVSERQVNISSLFLEYWRGYQFLDQQEVDLRSEIEASLKSSHVFMPLLDFDSESQAINFFSTSSRGRKLRFTRDFHSGSSNRCRVFLNILLPPLRDESRAASSTTHIQLSYAEIENILKQRQSPLLLIDFSDESFRDLSLWLELLSSSPNASFVVTTKNVRRAERVSDLLPTLDLLASTLSAAARGRPLSELLEILNRGPVLMSSLVNAYRVLNNFDAQDYRFQALASWDHQIQSFLQQPQRSLWLLRGPTTQRSFQPLIEP
jgi:hypothetical protein